MQLNSAAKTIVTITAPPAAAASASSLHLGASGRPSSVSTLTLATVPPSLLLEPSLGVASGSVSAAATPVAPATKHTTFALPPTTMGAIVGAASTGHHVSFMPMYGKRPLQRVRSSNSSLSSPTTATATASAPSLIEAHEQQQQQHHRILEFRQSVQSQITTLEDVDDVEDASVAVDGSDDSDSESVGLAMVQTTPQLENHVASSSSSSSVK